jgi:parallel beta-helix repeat protein
VAGRRLILLAWAAAVLSVVLLGTAQAQNPGTPNVQVTPLIELRPGLVIDASVRVRPGTYHIPADSSAAIRISGDDISVDFSGAVLVGSTDVENPDTFTGTGILIEPGSNIAVKGATVKGYKVAIRARDTPGLAIADSDLSYNWRQRLKSTIEREHLDDWMSYHNNEADEWLRFGAAVYARGCSNCLFENITVTGGQNGLMLTEVNDSIIRDNTIVFNSSLGVGMYRSSRNLVTANRLNYNVRGYSHGVYNRGQDSAAILVYEQSSDNEFSFNSATHSGDGFFLWAGQTTMDTGEGGANGNLIYRNDFSFAPTNGIEITFSKNTVLENYIEGCWHGIWGGYSWDTVIAGNTFVDNEEHIAIEHGQGIRIQENVFLGGDVGVKLWERASQPADWGYSAARDVASQGFEIRENRFHSVGIAGQISDTKRSRVHANLPIASGDWELERTAPETLFDNFLVDDGAPRRDLYDRPDLHRDRSYILVDEWGPHDFRSPVLWPRSPRRAREQWFEVVGPAGNWRITGTEGIDSLSATSGQSGDSLRVWLSDAGTLDVKIDAIFAAHLPVTDRFGRVPPQGQPYHFGYSFFFVPMDWDVDFWIWDENESDPRSQPEAFTKVVSGPPVHSFTTDDLGFNWSRSPAEGLPPDYFATRAVGRVDVPAGTYVLDLTSDDGVRVRLDGEVIHEDWTWHPPKQEVLTLELGGAHLIEIEHFEINGFAALVASLRRAKD